MSPPKKPPKALRGLAAVTPEKRREIARLGGIAAQAAGTAHQFTPELAKKAGRKGGILISKDRKHMATIGAKGGSAVHTKKSKS